MAKTPVIDFEFNLKADQANRAISDWLAKSNAAYKTNKFNRGNADRAIAAQAKKYADMEVQYQNVKTKEIVKIVEEANKRKLILDQTYQNKRIEGASAATLKEIALQKQQLQQYTNILNQMLKKRDEVLHHGAGASIGLLGVGRNIFSEIPGLSQALAISQRVSGVLGALGRSEGTALAGYPASMLGQVGEAATAAEVPMGLLSAGVVALATGLAVGAKTAMDMQKALATLKAETVLTDEQINHIKENSLSFGAILDDDATNAVKAYQEVAKILGEDITKDQNAFDNITFSALTFSKAIGGGDIKAQVEDITMIANQFGMIGKNAEENARNFQNVTDVLVEGSKIGAGEIQKITEAVKLGGLEAHKAGLSFNEFVAIVGGAGKSIDIEKVGSMTNMLVNRMQSWGTSAAKQLHELGIAYSDIDPKQHGFIESMERLGEVLKAHETSPEYGDITQKLFGYGGRGGRVLADAIIQNIDKIKEFNEKLGQGGMGAAAQSASANLDTLSSSWGRFWQGFKKLAEPAGEAAVKALQGLLDALAAAPTDLAAYGELAPTIEAIEEVNLKLANLAAQGDTSSTQVQKLRDQLKGLQADLLKSGGNKFTPPKSKTPKTAAELAEDAKLRKQAYENQLETLRNQQAHEEAILIDGDEAKKKNEKDRERDMLALHLAFAQQNIDLAKRYGQKTGDLELQFARDKESLMKFGETQLEDADKQDTEAEKKRDEGAEKVRKRLQERNKKYQDDLKKQAEEETRLRIEISGSETEKALIAENVRYAAEEDKWKGHLDIELLLYEEHIKKLNEIRENDAKKTDKDAKKIEEAFTSSFKGIIDKAFAPLDKAMQKTDNIAGQFALDIIKKIATIEEDKFIEALFNTEKGGGATAPTGVGYDLFGSFAPTTGMRSYDVGGVVDKDQVAKVHKGETIIPAEESKGFWGTISDYNGKPMRSFDNGTITAGQSDMFKKYRKRIKENTLNELKSPDAASSGDGGSINTSFLDPLLKTVENTVKGEAEEIGGFISKGGGARLVGAGKSILGSAAEGGFEGAIFAGTKDQLDDAIKFNKAIRGDIGVVRGEDDPKYNSTKDNTQSTEQNTVSVKEATKTTTQLIALLKNGGKQSGISKAISSATTVAPLIEKLLGGDPTAKDSVTGWIGTIAPALGLLGLSEGGVGQYGKGTLAVLHGNEVTAPASSFADYSARMLEMGMKAAMKGSNTTINNSHVFKVDMVADGGTLRSVMSHNTVHDQITRAN